ncbi:MAG TPA: hypothetical protein VMZ22_09470 [Acidimicrobiales bacterium]|nr:hypothetical protein [Acidimicrobiales bacterium]
MRSEGLVGARGAEAGGLNLTLIAVLPVSVCIAVVAFATFPRFYVAGLATLVFVGFTSTAARAVRRELVARRNGSTSAAAASLPATE